jgi:endoglucanase
VGKRYVVQKSVTATLDLCATAAYASRLFRKFNGPLPGFADSALNVARKAWKWSRENPTALYRQNDLNKTFSPAIVTGEYGDGNPNDELFWAGTEMYLATREDSFFVAAAPNGNLPVNLGTPTWSNVSSLGLFSLFEEINGGYGKLDSAMVRQRLLAVANVIRDRALASPYGITMGNNDFIWGSNSVNANQGMFLIQAFRATEDSTYLKAAVDALDYMLGRNATGYSFVTGFGAKTPMFPHHRPSTADGVREPVPGMLVGGPNSGQQDKCVYPSVLPALSFSDTECSYASNEIAINWNAPLAYLAGSLEAMLGTGAPAIGIGPRTAKGKAEAFIGWEGGTLRVVFPEGWKGKVEVFDLRGGRVDKAAMDTAGSLWVYRLHAKNPRGGSIIRSGALSPYSALRINLGR